MTRSLPGKPARAALAVTLLLLGAAGCASPNGGDEDSSAPALIEVFSQPDHTGEPISLDLPVHSSGAFEFEQWPSACDLADQETLHAVLPGASEIEQQAESVQMTVLSIGEGTEGPHTIPEARCVTSVGFDADGLRLSDGNVVMDVSAEVLQAGEAEFVERNSDLSAWEQIEIGDATCVNPDPAAYTCAMENIAFTIVVDARLYEQYAHTGGSIYIVDGEEIDYSGEGDAFMAMVEEKILAPVVASAVERLSR